MKVTILGEEYTIRSDAPPEHTRAVAVHYDQAVRQVMNAGLAVETQRAAILAALQITGELLEARRERADLAERMQRLADEVRPLLPPAKRGA
ncbi:MAG TPA: cell division protein ZapA [Gemmatimonadaceae bacterium]|nr:cell division protein ZapA [Gemmatimonadaceae bacterium]